MSDQLVFLQGIYDELKSIRVLLEQMNGTHQDTTPGFDKAAREAAINDEPEQREQTTKDYEIPF